MRRALFLLLSAGTLLLIGAVLFQIPFANGPAEWEWTYRPPALEARAAVLAVLVACLIAWRATQRADASRRTVSLLILLGAGFTFALVEAQPGGFARTFQSLASRNSFGYVFDAGLAPPTRELLADYPRASAGLYQHSRTHPPGPLLLVRGLDVVGRRLGPLDPARSGLLDQAERALDREAQRARDRRRPAPRPGALPAPGTLVLLAFLLPGLSALAGAGIYRLGLAWGVPERAALLAAGLWLLVPARSLFTPTLDQALPALLILAAVLATPSRPGLWRPLAAGVLLGLCTVTTYGYVVMLPLLALLAAFGEGRLKVGRPLLLGAGFILPWLALILAGFDLVPAFRIALAEHHGIAVLPRSYSTWLAWNPYDFTLLLGPIVLGLALTALPPSRETPRTAAYRIGAWAWCGTLLLLLAAGSVRGEVGRIWLMFMPFACLLAATEIVEGSRGRDGRREGSLLILLQAALCLALAASMNFVS